MRGIGDLFQALQYFLPPWALGLAAGLAVLLALPAWFHNVRSKQIRTRLRRMAIAQDPETRQGFRRAAFELAGQHGTRLLSLALEANKRGMDDVFHDAVARLGVIPKFAKEAEKLRKQRKPDTPPPRHPIEEAVFIERMAHEGMLDVAQKRLNQASERFPDDPDLANARQVLETATSASTPPRDASTTPLPDASAD